MAPVLASETRGNVRVPAQTDTTDTVAAVLLALETGDVSTFTLDARAERSLHQTAYRPLVRMVMDGWCWFLTPAEAELVALGVRLDPGVVGGQGLDPARRDRIADLVADAFEAAVRQAVAFAESRNAAGPGQPVPLFAGPVQ